jgi:hypothetical protein
MQAAVQNYNLTLPVCDAGFLKTMSKKNGLDSGKSKKYFVPLPLF